MHGGEKLRDFVQKNTQLVPVRPLPDDAVSFRSQVQKLFFAKSESRHALATMQVLATHVLNADWRQESLIHMCRGSGCCQDRDHCCSKILRLLLKLTKSLRPKVLNRSNWARWHESLNFMGAFTGIHRIFPAIYIDIFQAHVHIAGDGVRDAAEHPDDGQDDEDATAELRRKVAENKRISLEWVRGDPLEALMLLRGALHPAIHLMSELLHLNTPAFDIEQLASQAATQTRTYAVLALADGSLCRKFFLSAFQQLHCRDTWVAAVSVETSANEVFRVAMRSVSVVFLLLQTSWASYPWRLFLLLCAQSREAIAEEVMQLKNSQRCRLDAWTLNYLSWFPDVLSEQSLALLSVIALDLDTTTWSTETLHSKHARRTRSRVHTDKMHLNSIAIVHSPSSAPWWKKELDSIAAMEEARA